MESFAPLPASAAWRHVEARDGFEAVFVSPTGAGGWRFDGHSVAVEHGVAWAVRYAIEVDAGWATRWTEVRGRAAGGERRVRLDAAGPGRWLADGRPAPGLDGCADVDLEASACTNTVPVHRLSLAPGDAAGAHAAYVRAADLAVERLDQTYRRVPGAEAGAGAGPAFDYSAPVFDVACRLVYDRAGLVVRYPGLAVRVI